jgi:hypothetical protein
MIVVRDWAERHRMILPRGEFFGRSRAAERAGGSHKLHLRFSDCRRAVQRDSAFAATQAHDSGLSSSTVPFRINQTSGDKTIGMSSRYTGEPHLVKRWSSVTANPTSQLEARGQTSSEASS